jgi:hypothetical protein
MTQLAAGQPFYESTWLAAGSILFLLLILSAVLLIIIMAPMERKRWIWQYSISHPIIATGVAGIVLVTASTIIGVLRNETENGTVIASRDANPVAQDLFQQHIIQDERALDKGVLTYPALPTLKAGLPAMLSVTVTDLGEHPGGSVTNQYYSQNTDMVVYPRNVPTGGIVALHLTCVASVYCQALSSTRQAIIGFSASKTWDWDLTPLQAGSTSVTITATTYDGDTTTVLDEEIIPIRLTVEEGPWWAEVDDWWHAITRFTNTTAGLITTVGGAVAVVAGGAGWMRRKRARKDQSQPDQKKTSGEDETNADQKDPSTAGKESTSRPANVPID